MFKNRFPLACFVCICVLGAALNARTALSQQPPKIPVLVDEQDQTTSIFHLKFVKAEEAMRTIKSLFAESSPLALSVDERINALLVRANPQLAAQVEALLQVIDSQQPQSPTVKTIPLERESSNSVLQALRAFDLSSVEMAITAEGGLILRGTQKDVAVVEEIIKQIGAANAGSSKDISIQLIWLTERSDPQNAVFEGPVADQLTARGFKPLSILSELEVSTVAGGMCDASGAAGLGDITSEIRTHQEGQRIMLELDVVARYVAADKSDSRISFSTELTTPMNRWIVFGVAQRQTSPGEEAGQAKDVFLIRVKEQSPLQ